MDESSDFVDGVRALGNNDSIKVLVRVRPLNEAERQNSAPSGGGKYSADPSAITITSPTQLTVTTNDHRKAFNCEFDAVLGPDVTQSQVYETVQDCTLAVLQGVNSTIFAYGQTGSGKVSSFVKVFFINDEIVK
jgi:hypothetical protein